MADDFTKTVRIQRPTRVAEDERGRNVWVGKVETVELELVSTTALQKIMKSADGKTQAEIRNLAAGADPDEVQAVDVMTAPIIEVEADEPVAVVARTMLDAGIRHMPIRREGEIAGMISIRDVLDAVLSA